MVTSLLFAYLCFFFIIRRPPRSTLFPTRRSSDLQAEIRPLRELGRPRGGFGGMSDPSNYRRLTHRKSGRSEEHTSELQSRRDLVCRLLLEKKNNLRHLRGRISLDVKTGQVIVDRC